MKRILILTVCGGLAFASCTDFDFSNDRTQQIKDNAEEIFGIIDPNQDWNMVTSGTVTVTADAPLTDVAKVQILSESPFFNDQAKVLSSVETSKGETVTLNYDAPRGTERLIAACVDSKGNFFIKGFYVGTDKVSFVKASNARTRSMTRAGGSSDLSGVTLNFENSFLSYNAERTINASGSWKNSGWENDRLWQPTGTVNGWTMNESTIYTSVDAITEEERLELVDIFSSSLYRDDKNGYNGRRDNLPLIREGNAVKFFNNHLVADGNNPITLIPVQLATTDATICDIYYYYFKPEDVPSDMSEADYIKTLPKYKAIDLNVERSAFSAQTGIKTNVRDENFLRVHEYLLPYYGDASEFTPQPSTLTTKGYTTNGNFYRISNYSGYSKAKPKAIPASNHYITYGDKEHNLKDEYTDNIENQLWQVFTNANDNTIMLYNVGSGKFFWWDNNTFVEFKDITENSLKNYTIYISDGTITNGTINSIAFNDDITNQKVFISSAYKNNFIKARIDTGISYLNKGDKNISGDYRASREWTFEVYNYPEDYEGTRATAITDFELSLDYIPSERIAPPSTTPSATIPAGYKIGFMIRKDVANGQGGCLYGYGELNRQINTYGQFKSALDNFSMELNDPRIAMFNANGKTYLCFEEGSDAQYSDVIVELGGYGSSAARVKQEQTPEDPQSGDDPVAPAPSISTLSFDVQPVLDLASADAPKSSGVYLFDEVKESDYDVQAFTMCFEDRPAEADYDLNDVVLRCRRQSDTNNVIILTLEAAGGVDNVYLHGIPGTFRSDYHGSYDINNKEVHASLNKGDATGNDRMINTRSKSKEVPPVSGWYEVSAEMSIPQFLSQIYIENQSQANPKIGVPLRGEPPYAVIIPGDFDYPLEFESINKAYDSFGSWARNAELYDWLNSKNDSKVVDNTQHNP